MRVRKFLICAAVLALPTVWAAPGMAKGGDAVRVAAKCSPGVTGKLKAKNDSGRIEVEFEVDQNRNNRLWRWRIYRDGRAVSGGRALTRPPSGSFSIERRIGNPVGRNRVAFRALGADGKRCSASLLV